MRLYSQRDVDKKALRGARIAVLGYGSQGRAHALNLRDSGYDVVVGVRKGNSWTKAKKDGLAVAEPLAAVEGAQLISMLVPDMTQRALYEELKPHFEKGATLLFAHGFNIHFKQIKPRKDLDVVLIAPKGPGDLVRRQYQQGRGVPCLLAIAQNPSKRAKALVMPTVLEEPAAECSRRLSPRNGNGFVRRVGGALRRRHGIGSQGRDAGGAGYRRRWRATNACTSSNSSSICCMKGASQNAPFHQRNSQVRRLDPRTAHVNKATKKKCAKSWPDSAGKFMRQWIAENKGGAKYSKLLKADLAPIESRRATARQIWLEAG